MARSSPRTSKLFAYSGRDTGVFSRAANITDGVYDQADLGVSNSQERRDGGRYLPHLESLKPFFHRFLRILSSSVFECRASSQWGTTNFLLFLFDRSRCFLNAVQHQINSVNDLLRHLLAAALDLEIAHLKRVFARILVDSVICGVAQSFSPLDLWRNQSITKFTLKVRSAIAAAGSSGVKSPKVMRTEFVRTMLPQSAVGG